MFSYYDCEASVVILRGFEPKIGPFGLWLYFLTKMDFSQVLHFKFTYRASTDVCQLPIT